MSGAAEALAPDNPVLGLRAGRQRRIGHNLVAATANCANCHVRFELQAARAARRVLRHLP